MINPGATQILRNIEAVLAADIVPAVDTTNARSTLATIGHLLRHVALRIDHEGQMLADDIAALRPLLAKLQAYLESAGDTRPAAAVAKARQQSEADEARYPSLAIMAARAALLRQALQDVLTHLQGRRDARGQDAAYLQARADIRAYLALQLDAEATLIDPAFANMGPRR